MKKKRIVKLEPQTVELFAEVLSKLRPPPPLTVSQWADRYRVLSAESSAEPGRWHTEKAPYQRAIMDAIGDPHVRSVVVMSAAQIGKTDAFILNPLGYYMDYAPCPVMCMQPTLDMGQTLSKDRIAPMIRDTPRLTGLVDTKSRYAGNTVMKKNFPGGHITIVGANSPSSLASRPIKVLLADEIDRYPKSAGTEGDPLDLAKKRQTTFWDYKTVMVSTPTIKGDSRIEDAYLLSTQEEWNVPCPECGAYTDSGSDSSDSLSIKVNAMDHKWIDSWMPDKEAVLHPTLCTTNWIVQGDRTVLDCGTLVVDDLSFSACPDVLTIGAVARPNGTSFHEKTESRFGRTRASNALQKPLLGGTAWNARWMQRMSASL